MLTAVLGASRKLLSSPESAPISRGAAGPLAAALLQALAMLEPEARLSFARRDFFGVSWRLVLSAAFVCYLFAIREEYFFFCCVGARQK